jgi:DnaJ-class molecular chaperone
VKHHWRVEDTWIAVERSSGAERELDRSFADEVAIDFPAVTAGSDKVVRMRLAFDEADFNATYLSAEITLSRHQAGAGAAVPLEVPLRWTCKDCGGRGEVWGDRCEGCQGSGHALRHRLLTVSVPAGVVDGARFTFSVSPPRGPRTRVHVRVFVT